MANQGFQQTLSDVDPSVGKGRTPTVSGGGSDATVATALSGLTKIAGMGLNFLEQQQNTELTNAALKDITTVASEAATFIPPDITKFDGDLVKLASAQSQGRTATNMLLKMEAKYNELITRNPDKRALIDDIYTKRLGKSPSLLLADYRIASEQAASKAEAARIEDGLTLAKELNITILDDSGNIDITRTIKAANARAQSITLAVQGDVPSILKSAEDAVNEGNITSTLLNLSNNPEGWGEQVAAIQSNWSTERERLRGLLLQVPTELKDDRKRIEEAIKNNDDFIKSVTGLDSRDAVSVLGAMQDLYTSNAKMSTITTVSPEFKPFAAAMIDDPRALADMLKSSTEGRNLMTSLVKGITPSGMNYLTGSVSFEEATPEQRKIAAGARTQQTLNLVSSGKPYEGTSANRYVEGLTASYQDMKKNFIEGNESNARGWVDTILSSTFTQTVNNGSSTLSSTDQDLLVKNIRDEIRTSLGTNFGSLTQLPGYNVDFSLAYRDGKLVITEPKPTEGSLAGKVANIFLHPARTMNFISASEEVNRINSKLDRYIKNYDGIDKTLSDNLKGRGLNDIKASMIGSLFSAYGRTEVVPTTPEALGTFISDLIPEPVKYEPYNWGESAFKGAPNILGGESIFKTTEEDTEVSSSLNDIDNLVVANMFKNATEEELETVLSKGSDPTIISLAKTERDRRNGN